MYFFLMFDFDNCLVSSAVAVDNSLHVNILCL